MMLMYLGMLASYIAYIYFRIRYTLKIAKDQKDRNSDAQYTLSVYSIFTLGIELLCMAAMCLFAGKPSLSYQVSAAYFDSPESP